MHLNYLKNMYEVRRPIPTIREIFAKKGFKSCRKNFFPACGTNDSPWVVLDPGPLLGLARGLKITKLP